MAETRHAGTGVVGLGVPNLAPGVLHNGLGLGTAGIGDAANLAVVVERRAQRAERDFFLADLVAVVAVATICAACLVGPGHASAVLGNFLALFPITDQLAVLGPLHGFQIGSLNCRAALGIQWHAHHIGGTASGIGFVLLQAIHLGNTLVAERRCHGLLGQSIQICAAVHRCAAQHDQGRCDARNGQPVCF
ncbi:hypothetical protein D3C72_1407580 [compost metagenome]